MSTDSTITINVVRSFEASPEEVFDAFTDPEIARQWLFAHPEEETVKAEIDARVGGRFTITRRGEADTEHTGEFLELDRPRKLVFTFAVPRYSPAETRITIEIVPQGAGCELTLFHEGVPPEWADATKGGWNSMLGGLEPALRSA